MVIWRASTPSNRICCICPRWLHECLITAFFFVWFRLAPSVSEFTTRYRDIHLSFSNHD
ncbi:hypothetical protein BD410DRAFT_301554 [Rickenella mellea]|uniref:Uncharacterized protein n=1 Tax=Rickenella mellea TaxID=50990 RepID=A0A4Y7Q1Z8_9AGAM|nr:hypothetical protein BD410DRAFT_301554 [Rickenella mellea]